MKLNSLISNDFAVDGLDNAIIIIGYKSNEIEYLNQEFITVFDYSSKDEIMKKKIGELEFNELKKLHAFLKEKNKESVGPVKVNYQRENAETLFLKIKAWQIELNNKDYIIYSIKKSNNSYQECYLENNDKSLNQDCEFNEVIQDLNDSSDIIGNRKKLDNFLLKLLRSALMFIECDKGIVFLKDFFNDQGYMKEEIGVKLDEEVYRRLLIIFDSVLFGTRMIKKKIMDVLEDSINFEDRDISFELINDYDGTPLGLILFLQKEDREYNLTKSLLKVLGVTYLNFEVQRVKNLQREQKNQLINQEVNIAAHIQTSFIPKKTPRYNNLEVALYSQPSKLVGGDYLGFHEEEDKFDLLISDVMGKGIPAAIVVATIHSAFNILSDFDKNSAQILSSLNSNLYHDLKNQSAFVSMFHAIFDFKEEKLRYSNAAHNPPLLWSPKRQEFSLLSKKGILCGVESEYEYSLHEVKLEKGDIIIFYTDGLTDLRNVKGDRFKLERVKELIKNNSLSSAEDLKDRLIQEISLFIKEQPQPDDISFVITKFLKE
ncbi:PP2C family protein-serine/threonine phosphatase [Sporohalobacter salinus]|uniref:PP2C family protein-serine/threonine phosphatase n=1 Tax=Sporohalobacter salinus TaxID=1494606 RepID=UPI00195FB1B4|nr:SpoIIE family protein phosphatase [Sporohalobacter salinus]MBM7622553.1 serine phosphatase RsbU (regulator of sigma subunit) [Sporohalobacter salinus]